MTEAPVTTAAPGPETIMPGVAAPDSRPGYSGVVLPPDRLLDFALALRDTHGYDYLSSVTGVDYFPENKLEVVYHAYRTSGGPGFVFKTQLPRQDPVAPSLFSVYPGVEFQEREAWDLFGIRFAGHPDLRRIPYARIGTRPISKRKANPTRTAGPREMSTGSRTRSPSRTT
jgi:NADH:ubiquinone oxidoreductase subunit C